MKSGGTRASPITKLLFCEGYEDKLFFDVLFESFGLVGFHVVEAESNSLFAKTIMDYQVSHSRNWERAELVIIVADNDDDPNGSFGLVCDQINRVFGSGSAPSGPCEKTTTSPPCVVLMLPKTGEDGCLESLCCHAARHAAKQTAATTDAFLELVHWETWKSEKRRAKAWLRSNLAVRCDRDPFIPLKAVFKKDGRLIPVTNDVQEIRNLANVISSFLQP